MPSPPASATICAARRRQRHPSISLRWKAGGPRATVTRPCTTWPCRWSRAARWSTPSRAGWAFARCAGTPRRMPGAPLPARRQRPPDLRQGRQLDPGRLVPGARGPGPLRAPAGPGQGGEPQPRARLGRRPGRTWPGWRTTHRSPCSPATTRTCGATRTGAGRNDSKAGPGARTTTTSCCRRSWRRSHPTFPTRRAAPSARAGSTPTTQATARRTCGSSGTRGSSPSSGGRARPRGRP